ncbi:MAG: Phosphoribosyl-ATP pyrophosphatase [Alphaproteobacteria bacterium MarineAlpha3_Bin5]|nr:phosphoribosyl-ATP diphosphatase [Magnetovibrio sp.]PPR78761.1 MAG: Phosphoribosyl-ATP pyrophosphatase [Alphaproteobacteria bacterium MarineAlpha3_Bin5]|tara:strand:+ start:196 stop:519 length:324 start_codon:yes stop_codon:yes gene_type:complete
MENHILEKLYMVIQTRESANPATSYTAKLLSGNVTQIAKKVGEEAVETALAAVSGSKTSLISESSDLLYHLLVLWKATGVSTRDVWAELDARFDMSGIEEKDTRDST